jgi:Flp pilus assembly protein TadG
MITSSGFQIGSGQLLARRHGSTKNEHGFVTVTMLVLFSCVLVTLALVVDSGRLIAAHRDAQDVAEEAARAAINGVEENQFSTSTGVVIDPIDAAQRAASVRDPASTLTMTVSVVGDTVTVSTKEKVSLPMLALFGLSERTVEGSGSARAVPALDHP